MNKQEFLEKAGLTSIPNAEYEIIEQVYAHHPSISSVNGKSEIAAIYNLPGGMRIIRDMLPTAIKAREIEDHRMSLRNQLVELDRQYKDL